MKKILSSLLILVMVFALIQPINVSASENGTKTVYYFKYDKVVEGWECQPWTSIQPPIQFWADDKKYILGKFTLAGTEDMSVGYHEVTWTFVPDDPEYETLTGIYKVQISPRETEEVEENTTPSLTAATVTLEMATTYDININDKPVGASYKWTSSDVDVVTVNSKNGKIKAVKEGTAMITCEVTYEDGTVEELTSEIVVGYDDNAPVLTDADIEIAIGEKYDIDAENTVAKSKYRWLSSNKAIVTITSKGTVKGISEGEAYITCTITTPTNQVIVLRCDLTVTK